MGLKGQGIGLALVTVALAGGVAAQAPAPAPDALRDAAQALRGAGYIGAGVLDASTYLPPPPADDSVEGKADMAALDAARARKGDASWRAAIDELHLTSPAAQKRIACAIGVTLTPAEAPAYYRMATRVGADLVRASYAAKDLWKRPRPYTREATPDTCYPADELAKGLSWSYPSGHSATGWLLGLILAQAAPDRASQVLTWGRNVGEHRIACRVHYPSDVQAGRLMASVMYAQLSTNPEFRADLEAAKAEIAAAKAKGAVPSGC